MKPLAERFVPKLLNFDQKQRRMEVAQTSLNEVNDDSGLLKRVITDDQTCVYAYDVETNQFNRPSGGILDRQDRQVRSNVKVILTEFFDLNGIVNYERRSIRSTTYKFNAVCVK